MRLKSLLAIAAIFLASALSAYNWPLRTVEAEHAEAINKLEAFAKACPDENENIKALLNDENMLDQQKAWFKTLLDYSKKMLEKYPPAPENDLKRLYVLHILDHVTHATQKGMTPEMAKLWNETMDAYALEALQRVTSEVEKTVVPKGKLAVWKIYNDAFIVKSENKTIGFDVHTMAAWREKEKVSAEFAKLAKILDMAFVSHLHGDHINSLFTNEMKRAGKTVLIPQEMQWKSKETAAIEGPEPIVHYGKYDEATDFNGIKVRSLPGSQDKLKNSLFAVTVDSMTILHCGDNSDAKMLDLIAKLGRIDLVLTTCWILTPAVQQTAAFYCKGSSERPQMAVTGHENELGHRVSNRESFMETFQHLKNRERLMPAIVTSYGENVCYPSGLSIQKGGLVSTALAKAEPLPEYPWKRASTIPIETDREYIFTDADGKEVENAPRAIVSSDPENKILNIEVTVPDAEIITKATAQDGAVYEDDAVEILTGSTDRADYHHIAVNSKGVVYDSRNGNAAWNGKYTVSTKIAQDGKSWTLNIAIPLEQLDAAGMRTLNICVLDKPSGKITNLIPTGGDFHDADGFGIINFKKK